MNIRSFFCWVMFVGLVQPNAWAAEILKMSGNKVMIKMEGREFAPDDTVFAYKDGKKRALIKILKVKEGAALGEVKKGQVEVGLLVKKDTKSSSGSESASTKSVKDST
ncbi:MAG: hypothetical protein NZ480_03275, partial [Bdellovibrionaceae bacterium]|nr:hypothetical protein [Pseudobdellovibrionaceae bacterium]